MTLQDRAAQWLTQLKVGIDYTPNAISAWCGDGAALVRELLAQLAAKDERIRELLKYVESTVEYLEGTSAECDDPDCECLECLGREILDAAQTASEGE